MFFSRRKTSSRHRSWRGLWEPPLPALRGFALDSTTEAPRKKPWVGRRISRPGWRRPCPSCPPLSQRKPVWAFGESSGGCCGNRWRAATGIRATEYDTLIGKLAGAAQCGSRKQIVLGCGSGEDPWHGCACVFWRPGKKKTGAGGAGRFPRWGNLRQAAGRRRW